MNTRFIKPLLIIAGIVFLGSMAYRTIHDRLIAQSETRYVFSPISRGTIERTVSSTGTLNALGTVVIGAQVSGIVDKVLVDFNDKVDQGQILATLDTAVFESAVEKAKAEVQRADAEYKQAESEFARYKKLYKKGHIAEQEFLQHQTDLEITQSAVRASEAVLKKEIANLDYAVIKSPIAGTIIERSVEAGQTITSSLSTPTLFIIAADLSKMQIEVDVDESDIGQIVPDLAVRFTVQAYPEKVFKGTVRQIRLNPSLVQNVVNYKVIVGAENNEGFLLPGMTTMVDFIVEKHDNVFMVPNEAIRFTPPPSLLKEVSNPKPVYFRNDDEDAPGKMVRLYYYNFDDVLSVITATTGISNDEQTELVAMDNKDAQLQDGMLVISGIDMSGGKEENGFSLLPKTNKSRRGPF